MNITTAVQRFAFSTLQNDVQDSTVMIGNASPTLLKYENNIYDYVASDQGIDQSAINPPPVITSAATFDAPENQVFIGKITASDPDNEPLTFSIKNVQGNVPGNFMSISTTGELNFIGGMYSKTPQLTRKYFGSNYTSKSSNTAARSTRPLMCAARIADKSIPAPARLLCFSDSLVTRQ